MRNTLIRSNLLTRQTSHLLKLADEQRSYHGQYGLILSASRTAASQVKSRPSLA